MDATTQQYMMYAAIFLVLLLMWYKRDFIMMKYNEMTGQKKVTVTPEDAAVMAAAKSS